jgi:5-methylcytosine-specific restriction endonuclease McrA
LHDIKNRIDDRKATVDHIVPRCLGGGDDPDNLRCLCHRCNSAQGKTYGGLAVPAPEYLRGYAHQLSENQASDSGGAGLLLSCQNE